jgi:hypothetical protein
MSNSRNLSKLSVDSNGDIAAASLDNVPPSDDASALTTGTLDIARIADASVTAAKLASGAAASNLGNYVTTVNGSTGAVTVQSTLVSGTNIKTINSTSLLGSGNITVGGGKVLQVLSNGKTDTYSMTSTSTWTAVPGLSVAITPSSTSSKILVLASVAGATNADFGVRCYRGGTNIGSSTTASASNQYGQWQSGTIYGNYTMSFMYLDSPATTSSTTYYIYVKMLNAGAGYINRREYANDFGGFSSITVLEIGA